MSPLTESTRLTLAKGQPVPNDPYFAFNSLLLHGDGANGSTLITDSSGSPKTVTAVGNAQISTAQSKFGGSSIAFDGNGDYLATTQGQDLAIGTSSFTAEFWIYANAIPTTGFPAVLIGGTPATGDTIFINFRNNNTIALTNATTVFSVSPGISANTWTHIAVVRSGATAITYADGIGGTPVACASNFGSNQFFIGGAAAGNWINGYIDDLRITKGVARYTSNFTPPTAPFPDF